MPGAFDRAEQKYLQGPSPFDVAESKYSSAAPVLSSPGRGGRTRTPEELDAIKQVSEARPEVDTFGPGRMAMGADQLLGLSRGSDKKLRGIHNIATGLGESSLVAAPMAPLAAVGGMLTGGAGAAIGHAGAKAAGLSDEAADVAGDVGAVGLGSVGLKYGPRALKAAGDTIALPKWAQSFRDNFAKLRPPEKPAPPPDYSGYKKSTLRQESTNPAVRQPTEDEIAFESRANNRVFKESVPRYYGNPEPVPGNKPLPLWHSVRDRLVGPPTPVDPIPATQTPSGRKPGGIAAQLSPATPKPAVATAVSTPAQTAAELMKAVGITPETAASATPEQWKMIEQHAGGSVDRKAAVELLKSISKPVIKTTRR